MSDAGQGRGDLGSEASDYDVIVVGGGAAGENAAGRAAAGGLSVVLVERELVGGQCSYWACMPSKALLRSTRALADARGVAGAREAVGGSIDTREALRSRDSFARHWDDRDQVEWVRGSGVTLLRGSARLVGPREVLVDVAGGGEVALRAGHAVVLATGSVPVLADVAGIDTVFAWGSRAATSARSVPGSLAVLGAGVVGVELAQAWARLGTSVPLIERGPRPLDSMEDFVGNAVGEALRDDGVLLYPRAELSRVAQGCGGVTLELTSGEPVSTEHLLVATGRRRRGSGSSPSGCRGVVLSRSTSTVRYAGFPVDGCTRPVT